jgi:hypothetical protein
LDIHESEAKIGREVMAMRFAPLRMRIHQGRHSGHKSGIWGHLLFRP